MADGDHVLAHFIAVNFHSSAEVGKLIASLSRQAEPGWRLTVVDNSDDRREFEALRRLCEPDSRTVATDAGSNRGYFGAAKWVTETVRVASSWTVVCNVDLTFDQGFTSVLRASSFPGVPAPSISWQAVDQNPYMLSPPSRKQIRRWKWQFKSLRIAQLVGALDAFAKRLPRRGTRCEPGVPIYAPHGSCLVLPGEFFLRGGSLAHPNFLFGEEFTIAEQCRALGLPVTYEPSLRAQHAAHASTGVWRSFQVLEYQRQSLLSIERRVMEGDRQVR